MYGKLDEMIVDAIRDGIDTYGALCRQRRLLQEAAIWAPNTRDLDRVIDRRLQVLRGRGAIKYVDRKWRLHAAV